MTDNVDVLARIDALITAVYRDRTYSPWEEGPMRAARFEQLFRERLPEWPLRNQTDLVYGGATAISFLLHPGHYIGVPTPDGLEARISRLGGQCYQALLEISHLGPFARIRFTRETFDRPTGELGYDEQDTPFLDEHLEFVYLLKRILLEEGIEVLPREVLDQPVPDVELDVTEVGRATVYHCLFDEE